MTARSASVSRSPTARSDHWRRGLEQALHLLGLLPPGDLQHEAAAGREVLGRDLQAGADDVEPVRPAVDGEDGVVRPPVHVPARQVGRVGHDDLEGLVGADGGLQRRDPDLDPTGPTGPPALASA